jgi:CRP-like cAMP-binding protein
MPTQEIVNNRILRQLPTPELDALHPRLTLIELKPKAVLHQPGDTVEHVYFPLAGMVSLLAVMRTGEAIETGIIGTDGVVGGATAIDGAHSFGQATVQIEGSALRMSRSHFVNAYNGHEKLRRLVNRYQAILLAQAQQNAACHALHTVSGRLCRWLLQARDTLGTDQIDLTQEFLSHMLGVRRNTVSLEAHTLQKAGMIRYVRGRITIVDRAGLEGCACECYSVIREATDKAMGTDGSKAGSRRR